MSIEIKKPSAEDAAAMLDYLKQIGRETDNLTFGGEGLPLTAEEEAACITRAANSQDEWMMVAKEAGRIIGDISLTRLPRRMQHRGDLGMAVLREYWNRGVGTALLREAVRFAKENGFTCLDLQVRCDNLAAIHLYEKFGFQKIGTHPCFFRMGEEDIPFAYMCLRLI